ncbi:MAG: HDOD domain-containing protein [Thioalkalivibrionaceae bacterium]
MSLSSFLSDTDRIVSFRPAVIHMLKVINDTDSDFAQVAEALSADPAVTARLLRWANSPLFGCPNDIETVGHAVALMGLDAIRQITIASSVVTHFADCDSTHDHRDFWNHAVASGHFARLLAHRNGNPRHNRLFTAALLANIGTLVFCIHVSTTHAELIARADRDKIPLMTLEQETFGFTRIDLGTTLLEVWGLPAFFPETIRRAFASPESQRVMADQDVSTLQLASELADRLLGRPTRDPREPSAIASSRISIDEIEDLLRCVDEELEGQLRTLLDPFGGSQS